MSLISHLQQQAGRLRSICFGRGLVWACLGAACVASAAAELPIAAPPASDVRRDAVVEAIERIMPSVVNIGTATIVESRDPYEDLLRDFFGYRQRRPAETEYSRGSGVIIDESGYVLTNDHVVRGASKVWVKLNDDKQPLEAEVVAMKRGTDLALLKLKGRPGQKFTAARFAQDDDLLLGETVLALGNPFGLGGSVSRGILSSKSRRPTHSDEALDIQDWLQTDAAINPGNSGGPLINLRSEVIGINVAVLKGGQGIGFAIPIKAVSEALSEIFTPDLDGFWFGARVKPGSRPLQVQSVEKQSPAEKAGVKPGDVVLAVYDQLPRNFIDLNRMLLAIGDRTDFTLRVRRDSKSMDLRVRMVREDSFFNAELIQRRLGASVQQLTPELSESLGVGTTMGLIIAGVEKGGPAAKSELDRRLIIQAINRQATPTVAAAARILHEKAPGETVLLSVVRERVVGRFIQTATGVAEVTLR